MSEKNSEYKALKKKLCYERKNGGKILTDKELKLCEEFSVGYKDYLNKAKTERENVSFVLKEAQKQGFVQFDKNHKYNPGDKVFVVNRECVIALAVIGKRGVKNGVNLSIAHIDAPRLDLKPNPVIETNDFAMFKTHYYGGIKKYQWTAIPLSLHGRIVKNDGTYVDVSIGEDENEPCFCITDLLPHLAREQMGKKMSEAIKGEDLNVMIGSMPFKDDEGSVIGDGKLDKIDSFKGNFQFSTREYIQQEYGKEIEANAIVTCNETKAEIGNILVYANKEYTIKSLVPSDSHITLLVEG